MLEKSNNYVESKLKIKRPRVFIASSSEPDSIQLMQQLKRIHDDSRNDNRSLCDLVPWTEAFETGEVIIDELLRFCREDYDYFIVFWTEDDTKFKGRIIGNNFEESERRFVPRDNCILEYGLGLSVFEKKRVFIFNTVDKNSRPADSDGIIVIQTDNNDENKLSESLKSGLNTIYDRINKEKFFIHRQGPPIICKDVLLEYERKSSIGFGTLELDSKVRIVANRPVETDDENVALRVVENIRNGIKYEYIYPADKLSNAETIVKCLQKLITTPYGKDDRNGADEIISELRKNMTIYLNHRAFSFQYCLHIINSRNKKLYIKWNDRETSRKDNVYYIEMSDSITDIDPLEEEFVRFSEKYSSEGQDNYLFAKPKFEEYNRNGEVTDCAKCKLLAGHNKLIEMHESFFRAIKRQIPKYFHNRFIRDRLLSIIDDEMKNTI